MAHDDPTPSYALRELASWLEHRTGGDEPRDESRILLARAMAERSEKIEQALQESVKLQAHYAELLNAHDGGERMVFANVDAWLARLEELAEPKADEVKQTPCPQITFSTDPMTQTIHAQCANRLHRYQIDGREFRNRNKIMRKFAEDLPKIHNWDPHELAKALSEIPSGTTAGMPFFKIRHPSADEVS